MRITVVSTALPRRCGLATFTHDLRNALCGVAPRWDIGICAVDRDGLTYRPEVTTVIRQDDEEDYRWAARHLAAAGTDLVMIQHEYGIFGGPDGAHVLALACELREQGVPYTVTLHTVLSQPSSGQAATLAELCSGAARVTVFTETARQLAVDTGLAEYPAVAVVPHGAPPVLRSFVDPATVGPAVRAALERVGPGRVLATFGLIGPSKGLEHAIAALPAVVRRHPDVRYLIAGATHPEVARHQGEAYRHGLADLAARLGVQRHVHFIDDFLTEEELSVLLNRTHLYVTPYRSPEQICSGALTFALAAGCAVVSTDYRYARDLLTQAGTGAAPGVLVSCGDVEALAAALNDLLADEAAWRRAHDAARHLGATLTWPSVATRFAEVAAAAARRRPVHSDTPVPPLRLDHLDLLTDEIGIIQFAPDGKPDPDSGYCVDDVARLAIVAAGLAALPGQRDPRAGRWLHAAMRFLEAARPGPEGMHNLMGYDGAWLDKPHLGDHVGRAVWGLGVVAASPETATVRVRAHRLLERALPAIERLEYPRSVAYTILGLAQVDDPTPAMRAALAAAAARLDGWLGEPDPQWPWFEPVLTYDNARLPEALLAAATRLGDHAMTARALTTVDWYLSQVGMGGAGVLRCVGNQWRHRDGGPHGGDEQPLDAAAVVELAVGAWRSTRRWRYARLARRAYAWFLGANRVRTPLYDERSGGCRDGLTAEGTNANQGAESTLAYYQALLSIIHAGLVPAPGLADRGVPRRPADRLTGAAR